MSQESATFYPHTSKGEYALVLSIVLGLLYAMIVVWSGNVIGLGPTLFGIGIYAGVYLRNLIPWPTVR